MLTVTIAAQKGVFGASTMTLAWIAVETVLVGAIT